MNQYMLSVPMPETYSFYVRHSKHPRREAGQATCRQVTISTEADELQTEGLPVSIYTDICTTSHCIPGGSLSI
jgi:hypothetical protein